jgi:hypothetical protein
VTSKLTQRCFATIGMVVLGGFLHPGAADARRTHASVGMSIDARADNYDFHTAELEGGLAITRAGTVGHTNRWMIPLVFDTVGAKTIVVTGRDTLARGLTCQAVALNRLGTVVSFSNAGTFTPSPSFGTITLNMPPVPAGSVAVVLCAVGGDDEVLLLGADYNQ